MNPQINKHLKRVALLWLALLVAGMIDETFAQASAFTYQGRLQDGSTNANGTYDFQFTLWDSLSGGTQQPQPSPLTVTKTNVVVANGVFTVQLDFGVSAFPGSDRFLEMGVRLAGGGTFTILSPRQPITSTPYAVRSVSASNADVAATASNATQLGGVAANQYVVTSDSRLSDPRAPTAGSANYVQNTATQQASSNFNISGNGTAGGTLSANSVNSTTKYSIGGNTFLATGSGGGLATSNTFTGFFAGNANTPDPNGTNGNFNSFFGSGAGEFNSTGFGNSFFGNLAGQANTAGTLNSFFGLQAGGKSTGSNNALFGFNAGFANTSGNGNAFLGTSAGSFNKIGNNNSFLGFEAGNVSNGDNNTFLGFQAGGLNTTGANNTAIGASAGVGANNLTNATAIGAGANVNLSNSLVLGSINPGTNVGIGTYSPTSRLHVVGDTNLQGNLTVSGTLTAQLPSGNTNYIQNTTSPQGSSNFNISGNGVVGGNLITSGNVGIGTVAPTSRLHVVGDTNLVGNLTVSGALTAQLPSGNANYIQNTTSPQGSSNFNISGNGVIGGNVGIGTSSPAVALEVRRNSNVASDWETGQLRISGASNPNMQLSLGYDTSSNLGVIQAGQAFTGFKNLALNPFDGNVGIGTSSPQSKLHVNGVIRMDALGSPAGIFPLCWNANDQIASCTSSSLRYKTGVQSFTGGLEIIRRLRPISFTWRDGGIHDVGLAAEEVEKVEPLLAYRNKKGEVEGVRYNQLSAVFINAFKEQQAQITQQEEQLKQQRQQIKRQQDQAKQQSAELWAQQQQLEELKKLVCRSHRRANVCK